MAFGLTLGIALAAVSGLACAAGEGELRDPTRPPQQVIQATAPASTDAPAPEPMLQSVLISGTRKSAIIDGERYKLGDTVSGARLVAIGEGEVVLIADGVRKTLRLFPQVDKRPPDATQSSRRGKTGIERK
jgi:MSHA biogenesis protein MshK